MSLVDRRNHHVVGLLGGLGNQLFQFAFGIYIGQRSGLPVFYDTSALRSGSRKLELTDLLLDRSLERERWLELMPYPRGRFGSLGELIRAVVGPKVIAFESDGASTRQALTEPKWWYGYWQLSGIVAEALPLMRQKLRLPPVIEGTIGIHVRRGDYAGNPLLLSPEYYVSALRKLIDARGIDPMRTLITVYSDDPQWCAETLKFDVPVQFADPARTIDDFRQLLSCEHLVLSRSTFSWWAAVLPERGSGSIVAPYPYVPYGDNELDLHGWIRQDALDSS